MRIPVLILLLFVVSLKNSNAQQLPVFSHFSINEFLFNPAATGNDGYTTVNIISRRQWNQIQGSPQTDHVVFQTRIFKRSYLRKNETVKNRFISPIYSGKIGLGASVFCDRAGLLNNSGVLLTYAYHIRNNNSQLSFGLTTGFYQFYINKSKLILEEKQDKLLNSSNLNSFYTDFNLGIYYRYKNFATGISALNLSESVAALETFKSNLQIKRLYTLILKYNYVLSPNIEAKTSSLIKFSQSGAIQTEIAQKFIFLHTVSFGGLLRTQYSYSFNIGVKWEKFEFGYARDYYFRHPGDFRSGTNEFLLAIRWGDNARRYRWVERF